jgi:nicotinamide-nucleotide amidase
MLKEVVSKAASELVIMLKQQRLMLSVAESCTGGMLGAAITSVAGSSHIFDGGFITYRTRPKKQLI